MAFSPVAWWQQSATAIRIALSKAAGAGDQPAVRHRRRTRTLMQAPYAPGDWVEHPYQPDWGVGQVQSALGSRVTVNFQHAGRSEARRVGKERVSPCRSRWSPYP